MADSHSGQTSQIVDVTMVLPSNQPPCNPTVVEPTQPEPVPVPPPPVAENPPPSQVGFRLLFVLLLPVFLIYVPCSYTLV